MVIFSYIVSKNVAFDNSQLTSDASLCRAQCPNEISSDKVVNAYDSDYREALSPNTLGKSKLAKHYKKDSVLAKTETSPFVDLAVIFETTVDSVHECMGLYGAL